MRFLFITAVSIAVSSMCGGAALAGTSTSVDSASSRMTVDIPAQKLGSALRTLAKKLRIQIVFASQEVSSLTTTGISGDFTTDEALGRLLSDTGFIFRYLDDKTVTIIPAVATTAEEKTRLDIPQRFLDAQLAPRQAETGQVDSVKLEEIIVTAERREESIQRTPVSVTALKADTLRAMGMTNLGEVGAVTPNMQFTERQGAGVAIIRGIGQNDVVLTADPGIGTYVDGVYLARNYGLSLDLLDVERVEVLRGPQGTLFGKNTLGGAINVITRLPGDVFRGTFDMRMGSRDRMDIGGTVDLPLIEQALAASLTVSSRQQDGYMHRPLVPDDPNNTNQRTARAKLRWRASESLELVLAADYFHQNQLGMEYQVIAVDPTIGITGLWNGLVGYPNGTPYDARYVAPERTTYGTAPSFDDLDSRGGSLTVNWTLGDSTLKSITAARALHSRNANDTDGSPLPIESQENYTDQDQFSQELQLSGDSFTSRMKWIMGVYFLRESGALQLDARLASGLYDAINAVPQPNSLPPASAVDINFDSNVHQVTNSYAAYAQATHQLTDKSGLTVGLRASKDNKRGRFANYFPYQGVQAFDTRQSNSWQSLTPRFGWQYQLTPDHLFYVSAAKGFKSGGYNGVALREEALAPYDPETLWSYEGGLKTEWWDGGIRVNAAVFHMLYDKIQIQQALLDQSGAQIIVVKNPGNARMNGFEADAMLRATRGLLLNAAFGYTDFKYTNLLPGAQVSLSDTLAYLPRWTGSVGAQYEFAFPEVGSLTARVDYNYRAKQYFDATNSEDVAQEAFGLLNARLTYVSVQDRWDLYAYGKNVTDVRYRTGGSEGLSTIGLNAVMLGTPREIGVGLTVHF